ncbi:sll1439 [Synechocystis sp. PCC 6803]|uniref:Sll1439 protein n=1 Tax=Synechocystis sp. (strain ATCC 27184 / PCC 6803 / Kazusa) TaxID=1111708 RepID=P74213_SYNY3|nr:MULTISPECIES: hypothetical protein [unclassified Synechocystis]BAM54982.1 hypothetical protein BEST7613_6051 [Synechocystis sp. PCC 6803] [Bacillus subtilis BEST7613]AGF51993.1 hypothetical protein MYO_117480 [Synechocystis sp. PCC 6803]ALJ67956.1 hypothetical protein AOY38_08985 [Synechocystis sp. PCC 6803]AVP89790.1 hypothetical protein C7I86_09015 [Synechocystis sp. IPPAS B-1465]MBD2619185.1 hypothetical protein [Synechocystis sp. FACHB-898]
MDNSEQWYTREERELLHKARYFSGSHNYFFELKVAKNGSKYIVIDQRKKVGDKFVGSKIRIFEDEMLEFERVLHQLISIASGQMHVSADNLSQSSSIEVESKDLSWENNSDICPNFFPILATTNNWQEFEKYTFLLLKSLGIVTIKSFLGEKQAGKADGFFRTTNLSVIYDCTLAKGDIETLKSQQIINYCSQLKQGRIEFSDRIVEEFHEDHKQVWIISRQHSRKIQAINSIEVKLISIQDLMNLYATRLTSNSSYESLDLQLRNI